MQVNYDRPSSQRPPWSANDSPLWFPNRRVGERGRVPSRRSGMDHRHASAPGVGRSLYLALAIHSRFRDTKEPPGGRPLSRRAATFLACPETLTLWESGTARRTRSRR